MERTKFVTTQEPYNVQEEPIVLSKPLFDLLLKQNNPGDCIALYGFYYYTAKWQQTNQPKATTRYAAKGLRWSTSRVQRTKQILNQLRLIEDIQIKTADHKIAGYYIKVNFIWLRESVKNIKASDQESQCVENVGGNALSSVSLNALSSDIEEEEGKHKPLISEVPITERLFDRFWLLYPNKDGKGKALTAWNRICTRRNKPRPLWRDITRAILAQKKSERWADPQFIPLPATWLNESRWLDDPAEMKAFSRKGNGKGETASPESIVYKAVKGKSEADWFITYALHPAMKLISSNNNGDNAEIAAHLCNMRVWYAAKQERPDFKETPERSSAEYFTYCNWNQIPSPELIVRRYVDWLGTQDWIQSRTPELFNPDGKIFQRFLNQYQKDVRLNFFNGSAL